MKRVILGWRTAPLASAGFRPIEELTWHLPAPQSVDVPNAIAAARKAEAEECSYVGEGEGLRSSFSTIAEALAFADFQGHTVVNRDEALAEQARRRGWSKRGG